MNETRTAETSGITVRHGRRRDHTPPDLPTARSHPLAGEGASAAGNLDVSLPVNCAGEGSQPPRRLSREEFLAIAAPMLARGDAIEDVAAACSITTRAVYYRIGAYGLTRAKLNKRAEIVRLYAAGWQPAEIGRRLGLSPRSVITYANEARRAGADVPRAPAAGGAPRKADWFEVCRLAREGWKQIAIAAQLGISQKAVSKILIRMRDAGVPLPPGGRWPERRAGIPRDAAIAECRR